MKTDRLGLIITFLLLSLGCVPFGTATPTISQTGEIIGQVIDSDSGTPISVANVSTNPSTSSVTTDAEGRYTIPGVPPGHYTVTAVKFGYTSASVGVAVVAGGITTGDIHLVAGSTTTLTAVTPTATTTRKAGRVLIQETFDEMVDLSDSRWDLISEDGTHWHSLVPEGNPGKCVRQGGGSHHQWASMYLRDAPIDFSEGLVITFDFYCVSTGWHYTDVIVYLTKTYNPANYEQLSPMALYFWANKAEDNQRNILMGINKGDADEESFIVPGAYLSDEWNSGRIEILTDGRAQFYVNEEFLWETRGVVNPGYSNMSLANAGYSGGGLACLDNLYVMQP